MNDQSPSMPAHEAPQSGAELMVGYRIDLTDPAGTAAVTLQIEAKHLNRNGTLHGGIHAMMLDAAGGFAASRNLSGGAELVPVQTLSLTTSFVGATDGGIVVARGRYTGGGHKIAYATAEITDEAGRVLSTAQGVFKRVRT